MLQKGMKTVFLGLIISISYWVIFAFSSGLFEFYSVSLYAVLSEGVGRIPVFALHTGNIYSLMAYSGLYWFPTYHFGISFPIFPFLISVLLTYSVYLLVIDLITIFKLRKKGKKSLLVFIPTVASSLFSTGACCTLPIAYFVLALFLSATTSFAVYLVFAEYSYLMDAIVISFMLWVHRRNQILLSSASISKGLEESLN